MSSETYKNFLRESAPSRPYEATSVQEALAYFNKRTQQKPYEITNTPDHTNYNKLHYDAELSNGEESIKVEVRTDHKSKKTGNFFVEYHQCGTASEIAITETDFYVINDTENVYLVTMGKIF